MATLVLEVNNLTKKYGDFTAVKNLSFDLKEGEILGLLGPNGAGKTTTMQMLLGLTSLTGGKIKYFGKNFADHRSEILDQVNFASAYTELPWLLTVKENLTYISYLYSIKKRKERLDKIKKIFELDELWNKELHQLSAGQKTRVNLAKSFINFPRIILLDEPTASLDPEVANLIREFLRKQRKEFEVSIIITSHNMAEVEELCDRVVFINHGEIIANDTPENLARTIEISHLRLMAKSAILIKLESLANESKLSSSIEGNHILIDIKEKEIPRFLKLVGEKNLDYLEISIERPTLEDYFLQRAKDRK